MRLVTSVGAYFKGRTDRFVNVLGNRFPRKKKIEMFFEI